MQAPRLGEVKIFASAGEGADVLVLVFVVEDGEEDASIEVRSEKTPMGWARRQTSRKRRLMPLLVRTALPSAKDL
jgi:hypothetical protein